MERFVLKQEHPPHLSLLEFAIPRKGIDLDRVSSFGEMVAHYEAYPIVGEVLSHEPFYRKSLEEVWENHPESATHSLQVLLITLELARQERLPDTLMELLSQAAISHDFGKKDISSDVLDKHSHVLSSADKVELQSHTQKGFDYLLEHRVPLPLALVARDHHVFARPDFDESAYAKEYGEDTKTLVRLISLGDQIEAMRTQARIYRVDPCSPSEVVHQLRPRFRNERAIVHGIVHHTQLPPWIRQLPQSIHSA